MFTVASIPEDKEIPMNIALVVLLCFVLAIVVSVPCVSTSSTVIV